MPDAPHTALTEELRKTMAALRREIGQSSDRDHTWQPMVAASEVRLLLDTIDDLAGRVAVPDPRIDKIRATVWSPEADRFRNDACRGLVGLPYANNRYVRLLDDLRAVLDDTTEEQP